MTTPITADPQARAEALAKRLAVATGLPIYTDGTDGQRYRLFQVRFWPPDDEEPWWCTDVNLGFDGILRFWFDGSSPVLLREEDPYGIAPPIDDFSADAIGYIRQIDAATDGRLTHAWREGGRSPDAEAFALLHGAVAS